MFLKEVSYADQEGINLIKNTVKKKECILAEWK